MMRAMTRAALVVAFALAACNPDGNATFQVRESVEQLYVTHAAPRAVLQVVDDTGVPVQTGTSDELGSLIFRKLAPGHGYRIETVDHSQISRHLTVHAVDEPPPDDGFYRDQKLAPG